MLSLGFVQDFIDVCADGYQLGWHESNGGNLSYLINRAQREACREHMGPPGAWEPLPCAVEHLAGAYLLVTGAGRHFRTLPRKPAESMGIVELNQTGAAYRRVWGLEGCRATSELQAHLLAYQAREGRRVVYHAHCPQVIALSHLIAPDAGQWTGALTGVMTEFAYMFPEGFGVLAPMQPGSIELARATADALAASDACVWAHHGLVATGANFDEAFGRAHTLEKAAALYLSIKAL